VVDVVGRQALRLRVMKAIFDESGGSGTHLVPGPDIREQSKASDQDIVDACVYLESEGLIECMRSLSNELTYMTVHITHRGIVEMEKVEKTPNQPTRYFPAASIVVVHGDGNTVQSGSPGAQQEVSQKRDAEQ
jgi:hypothetical protein